MLTKTTTAQPKVVNGINVDDLSALIGGVRLDAAKGKTTWRVTTSWQGQTSSRSRVEGFGIGGNRCRVNSQSISTSLANWADRTSSPIRKSI